MTWEIFVSLIVAITGLIGGVWTIIKYYDVKREKRRQEEITFMQEMKIENKSQSDKIDALTVRLSPLENSVEEIKIDLQGVHTKLNAQEITINDNEMNRLQTAIMDFADKLRSGYRPTLNNFNYIFHAYDEYHRRGGNSFIESEMQYIREQKQHWGFR